MQEAINELQHRMNVINEEMRTIDAEYNQIEEEQRTRKNKFDALFAERDALQVSHKYLFEKFKDQRTISALSLTLKHNPLKSKDTEQLPSNGGPEVILSPEQLKKFQEGGDTTKTGLPPVENSNSEQVVVSNYTPEQQALLQGKEGVDYMMTKSGPLKLK